MICISIGDHRGDAAERFRAAMNKADVVELRMDMLGADETFHLMSMPRTSEVIVTCRKPDDGGEFRGSEEERMRLLAEACRRGADWVDVEAESLSAFRKVLAPGTKTKIIASWHDFSGTDGKTVRERYRMMCEASPDAVKIVTAANDASDNFVMFDLLTSRRLPTVAFCMGEAGILSRVLSPAHGAAWTYACLDEDSATAPGQIPVETMKDLYRAAELTRSTRVYGVLADPVGHSMSPLIHNTAFRHEGIDAVYLPILLKGDVVSFVRKAVEHLPVGGFSVTIPHKVKAMAAADEVDDAAREAGALNTLVVREDGIHGYNTDIPAAIAAMEAAMENAASFLRNARCLLLGAGGAGRALAIGLGKIGTELLITDGVYERAKELAASRGAVAVEWEKRETVEFDMIANATPIGMHPHEDEMPVSEEAVGKARLVFDAVYNPPETKLLKTARRLGVAAAKGLDMFVKQAVMQFELWTGVRAPEEVMRECVVSRLHAS